MARFYFPRKHLRISPSQVKRFHQCPRKTAWQLNASLPREVDPYPRANDLGTRGHTIAEEYLKDNKTPDMAERFRYWRRVQSVGRHAPAHALAADHATSGAYEEATDASPGAIFAAGMRHLPVPQSPGLVTEAEAGFTLPDGLILNARGDYKYPTGDGTTTIGDHKFVRDLGYALSATPGSENSFGEGNYLGDDPQALIQAAATMVADPAAKALGVPLEWVYYQTNPKNGKFPTRKVHLRLLPDDIRRGIGPVIETARVIQGLFDSEVDPLRVPANGTACNAFGRVCEHVSRCNLSAEEKYMSHLQDQSGPAVDARVAKLLEELTGGTLAPTVGASAVAVPAMPALPALPATPALPALPAMPAVPALPALPVAAPSVPPLPAVPALPALPAAGWKFNPNVAGPPPPPPPNDAAIHAAMDAMGIRDSRHREAVARYLVGPDPINPPEAPAETAPVPTAPAARVDPIQVPEGGYAAMDRDGLKALAVERGLLKSSSRNGAGSIRELLEEDDRKHAAAPAGVVVPPDAVPATAVSVQAMPAVPAMPALPAPAPAPAAPDTARLARLALDRINAVRAELLAIEEALHTVLGV